MKKTLDLSFLKNGGKASAFQMALISHGLGDNTHAERVVNHLRKMEGEMRNSTESRMTLYTAEINPFLYPDNSFITRSQNDAAFAASGETKRLNDSAAGPTVTKGRVYAKSLANGDNAPAKTVKVRKNGGHDWAIEYFHTDPDALTSELTKEVPYEARGELLRAHSDVLNNAMANFTAVEWAQGEVGVASTVDTANNTDVQFIFTSDTTVRANPVVGTTGNVKRMNQSDFKRLKSGLIRQQLGKGTLGGKMYYLPTVDQYDDMQDPALFPNFINYNLTGHATPLAKGEVGLMFDIIILDPRIREDWGANIVYSYTALAVTSTDLTKIEDTASTGANMVSAGMAWVDTQVLRAQGSAIVFPWMSSPIYMGDVYASEARYAAKKKRGDGKGVIMMIENPF